LIDTQQRQINEMGVIDDQQSEEDENNTSNIYSIFSNQWEK